MLIATIHCVLRGAVRSCWLRLALLAGFLFAVRPLADGAVIPVPPTSAVFHPGNPPGAANPDLDDRAWVPVAVDRSWHAQAAGMPWRVGDDAWYRLRLVTPDDFSAHAWTLSAGFVGNICELWLNGRRLGRFGSFEIHEVTGQRTVHALPVPPGWLRAGTNLFALRVRNVGGQGGLLGGPVGLFETADFLPVVKRLELQREAPRVVLAALCFGWALVPLGFRLVGDRSGVFDGAGLPALLIGIGVGLHTQWAASLPLGPARPLLAAAAWLIAGLTGPAIYGFARRLGARSRGWDLWVAVGAFVFFGTSLAVAKDVPRVMEIYAGYVVWGQVAILAQCRRAAPANRLLARAVMAGTSALTLGGLGIAALGVWPLTPFAAQWWDFSDLGILVFLAVLGGTLLRGHVLSRRQEIALGSRLIAAHAEERSQLGRQVHDTVLQDVQYLKLQAHMAEDDPATAAAKSALSTVAGGLGAVARDLRELSADLQPLAGRPGGLQEALEQLAERLERRHGVPVRTSVSLPENVPGAVQETLYRLAREAAGNACRHSGAPEVRVAIVSSESAIELTVSDRGRGFVPAGVPAGRLGLGFLRDHAAWIGANLELSSAPGTGTTVRVTVFRPFTRS